MTSWQSKCVVHKSYRSDVYVTTSNVGPLKPTQVLVKTDYASINPADCKIHALSFRDKEWHTLRDFSGTVEAVGSDVKGFSIGEAVYGSIQFPDDDSFVGSYSPIDISKNVLAPIPPSLTTKESSALPVAYNTAFQIVDRANTNRKLDANSNVLILGGATSVGTFAIQLAKKYFGAGHVVASCSPSSEEYVRSYGADDIINYRVSDIRKEFIEFVTHKQKAKFDAIIDCVGGYDAIAISSQILKPVSEGSTYTTIMGDYPPAKTYAHSMVNFVCNVPRLTFRYWFGKYYGINFMMVVTSKDRKCVDAARTFFATPGVKVPIDSVYPVEDVKAAWEKVDSTRARGKVIVQF